MKENLENHATCINDYDKEEFGTALKEQVGFYGLQTMYSIPDRNGSIRSLLVDTRLFDLKGVVSKFNSHMISPPVVLVLDQCGNETSQELPESI